jgi:DNA-binding CsgD family transcriptional regulator/tetratricopeptide (TPR) repeat protein
MGSVTGARFSRSAKSVLATRVVGRDAELATLYDALDTAAGGAGGIAFLVGEAGIGKSRLAAEVDGAARERDMTVMRGRAVPGTSPVAYRPLVEALCAAVRATGVPDSPELAPFRPTLARLVPEWRVERLEQADDSVIDLAEAVVRFLRALAGDGGCLLVLEDLHWADAETLTVVEYLADNLVSERVLCLATVRIENATPALALARTLDARRVATIVELERLDGAAVTDLVASCLDTTEIPGALLAIADRADGVPFLVEELLAATVASGALVEQGDGWTLARSVEPLLPITFVDSVRRRLDAVGDGARDVLAAAAVLGRRFDWDLLPPLTGLDERAVLAALQSGIDAQLLATEPDGAFRFRHALSRDAVLATLLPPERAAVSARALDVVSETRPGLPGPWCELASELAQAAGHRDRAAALLVEAGRRAIEAGALETAETTLERARVLGAQDGPASVDAAEHLLEALALAGKYERAVDIGTALLQSLGEDAATAPRVGRAQLRLARAAVAATRWSDAWPRIAAARKEAQRTGDEQLVARIDALTAHAAIGEDRLDEADEAAQQAFAVAERTGLPEVACEALEVIGRCARTHDLAAAEQAFQRAHDIAARHGLYVWRVRALHELGTVDLLRDGTVDRLQEARALAESMGALATAAVLDVQIAAGVCTGDAPESGLPIARRAADLARRYRLDLTYAVARAFEAHVHARGRRRADMEACLADTERFGHDDPGIGVIAAIGRAILALCEDDRSDALSHLVVGDPTGPGPGLWALLHVVAHDREDAPHAISLIPMQPVHFLALGHLSYAEAVLLGRRGRTDEASAMVAAGDERFAAFGWHRQTGRRHLAEAALADGWGDPVGWLREALAFFEEHDDEPLASACRSLLRRAGAPVPRRRAGGDEIPGELRARGVTGREVEVLRLLGEGRSNREIGERLYLSPRTVERHIANLTAKVGVERRAELVAFGARTLFGGVHAQD